MEELLEAPQLGRNPHLLQTLSTLVRKWPKSWLKMDIFYAYIASCSDTSSSTFKLNCANNPSVVFYVELVVILFSGRSNAENRTDVVSVRLQPFNVEQCNNITVMLKTGN